MNTLQAEGKTAILKIEQMISQLCGHHELVDSIALNLDKVAPTSQSNCAETSDRIIEPELFDKLGTLQEKINTLGDTLHRIKLTTQKI